MAFACWILVFSQTNYIWRADRAVRKGVCPCPGPVASSRAGFFAALEVRLVDRRGPVPGLDETHFWC